MSSRAHRALSTLSTAALVAACSLIGPGSGPLVPGRAGIFPHLPHAGEGGMECTDCHEGAEDQVRAGMPDLETCYGCHDSEVDPDLALSAQPAGFILEGDSEATWTSVTAPAVATAFSHAIHADAGATCDSCHEDVADSDEVDRDWKVGMSECLGCHEAASVEVGGCLGCHEGLDQRTMPGSHAGLNWQRAHGAFGADSVSWGGAPAQDCSLCHTESSCDSCHAKTPPLDHSEAWRLRGHGFSASMERDRCDTCHKEDSCVRCHQTATPVTHGGIWGGGTSVHCASCHIPLGPETGCTACHRGTPSHRLATSIPGGSHPGSSADCRSCHTPLDHFDNGQACTLCHR
ncbi:MAG: hypothetical protein ISR76_02540 [Planctomycetes bacterium]|nr:hypothetical protein [Planctomycetota bacterium]